MGEEDSIPIVTRTRINYLDREDHNKQCAGTDANNYVRIFILFTYLRGISGLETRQIPLHLPEPRTAWFLCGDCFWEKVRHGKLTACAQNTRE